MTLYELLLFVHVLAVAAWFGAALLSLVLLELASRAGEHEWLARFGEFDDALAKLLFIPAAVVTLLAGVALVFDGPWSFTGDGWVLGGLLLFAGIFVLGIGVIVPTGKKLTTLARSGAAAADLEPVVARLRLLSVLDVALLAVAIFLMTTKPF